MQACRNGRSFNSKFDSMLKSSNKAKSPMWLGASYGLSNFFVFPSNKIAQKFEEKMFKDFPENSTYEIEGKLKTNKPLLFWAKPMNLKLIKGK